MTAKLFKVGDKVRVKSDLLVGRSYDGTLFVESMAKYIGEEQVIAEVTERIYIMKEIPSWRWTDEMLEPGGILKRPIKLTKKQIEEKTINSFVESFQKRLKNIDDAMKSYQLSIADYNQSIVDYYKHLAVLKSEKENANKFIINSKTDFINKFNGIKKLPIVESAELTDEGIKVNYRGVIKMKYNNKVSYPLGKFYIIINSNKIIIRNETPFEDKINNKTYHSPHIIDSDICFGTYGDKVYELLGTMKYKELVLLIYLFLKSYNQTDCYMTIGKLMKIRKGLDPEVFEDDNNGSEGE